MNGCVIAPSGQPRAPRATPGAVRASAVARVAGRRGLRIGLGGPKGGKMPTITPIIAIDPGDEQPNETQVGQHRVIGVPAEVADARTDPLRVFIP